ncbi:MAG: FecR domain-containing protein [Sphingomonas fennica]
MTSDPFRPPHQRRAIEEQAARHVVRLRSGADAAERTAIAAWIGADPAHAVAFAEADLAWDAGAALRPAAPPVPEPAPVDRGRRRLVAGVVAAGAATAIGVPLALRTRGGHADYATAIGERRTVTLADGSRVGLNTDTRIAVRYGRTHRVVRLIRGEALFDVAHDAARPFLVEVGRSWIRAVGTAFNVRVRRDLAELTVTEGVVALGDHETPRTGEAPAARVAAGQGAVIRAAAATPIALDPALVAQRVAWADGVIDLAGNTVEQAVEEFNRYRPAPILIGDQRLASIHVGGRFETGEADKFLKAIQRTLPVDTVRNADGSVLLVYRE